MIGFSNTILWFIFLYHLISSVLHYFLAQWNRIWLIGTNEYKYENRTEKKSMWQESSEGDDRQNCSHVIEVKKK